LYTGKHYMRDNNLRHVAIIPDGNRRWAQKRRRNSIFGHNKGHKSFEEVLKRALDLDIYCISFWGMSADNLDKRDAREIKGLLSLFKKVMSKSLGDKNLKKHDVRISILGEWKKRLPKSLVKLFDKVIRETRDRKEHILNLLICYDGKAEMQHAFVKARNSKLRSASPKHFLSTSELPPVDLVIRTGGDPHMSAGFMMWDTADAQLHFSNKLWPDFTPDDFEMAVDDYMKRQRRFGA
jgi:undecaprenyl diphosphate synthase